MKPNRSRRRLALATAYVLLTAPLTAQAFEAIDNLIFGTKCLNAEDKEACKAKAKQEADEADRQRYGTNTSNSKTPVARSVEETKGEDEDKERCEVFKASGPLQVDDAYNRVMDAYPIITPEELEVRTRHRTLVPNENYKHVRVPGVRYDLWNAIEFPGHTKGGIAGLALRLSKRSSGTGTDLRAEVCVSSTDFRSRHRSPNPYYNDPTFWKSMQTEFQQFVKP